MFFLTSSLSKLLSKVNPTNKAKFVEFESVYDPAQMKGQRYPVLNWPYNEGLRIDGLRVFYRLELFPPEAVLGCAVDVPTLAGTVTLQVPPRSSSGRLLRLRGRGIELDGMRGDQLVEIVIVIPDELGDDQDALYKRLQEIEQEQD